MGRWILILAAVALAGCSGVESPSGLRVVATLSAATFKPSDVVAVSVVVTNLGTHDRAFEYSRCQKPFDVRTDDGTRVGTGGVVCDLALYAPITLEPGASYTFATDWAGKSPLDVLPTGTFKLTAWIRSETGRIDSAPAVFTISP